ncbi:MAG: dockerin type I domain-containing protein [bacterium]|nr:dockerin type I domain-containing protein [bacterium]
MFKKIFTVFLAFMFCVIPAFSSNVTALTIDGSSENFDAIINMNSSEHNGIYTFSVSVKLEDNRMVEGIHMQLNFNSEVFSVLSCNTMYSPDGEVQYKYNGNTGNITFLYINMNRTYIVSDTVLFEAKFTKNSGNFNDSYPFALTISDFYYQNIIDTNYAVVNRIIHISDNQSSGVQSGDVNQDGSIDSIDLLYLARYLANWEGYNKKVYLYYADTNGDGDIDPLDLIHLSRCIAGWSGYKLAFVKEITFS